MQAALERLEHSLAGLEVLTSIGQRRRDGAARAEADRASMTRRVGAVDIGTNSTRLLVADVSAAGGIAEVERLLEITRLGDRRRRRRRLGDAAMARVHAVLERYAARAAAARRRARARDRHERRPRCRQTARSSWPSVAAPARIRDPAPLGRRGGGADLPRRLLARRPVGDGTLICDIGGGSTELVLGGPDGVRDRASLNIGCVRLSERHLHTDPPTADELAALRAEAAAALPARLTDAARELVGVAGTVTTLATIDMGLECEIPEVIDGHRLPAAAVERLLAELAALPLDAAAAGARAHARAGADDRGRRGDPLGRRRGDRRPTTVVVSERDILHGARARRRRSVKKRRGGRADGPMRLGSRRNPPPTTRTKERESS